MRRLHAIAPIRILTFAPEIDGHLALVPALVALGIRVQAGHSLATYEDGVNALTEGAVGFTHLFNAMTAMHHRKPGLVGAALAHAEFAEIIPDLLHVHPGAIRAAARAILKLFCVTDSTAATGMPDGEYRWGGTRSPNAWAACVCRMGPWPVRPDDGSGAENCVEQLGWSVREASARVSTHAADFLGLGDRGRLQQGAWADMAVLDRDLNLAAVFAEACPSNVDRGHGTVNHESLMRAEALTAPRAIARQLAESEEAYRAFGEELRKRPPTSILTVARGSSDHAAHFMAYLIMARLGKLVTSLPMSLITLYQSNIEARGLSRLRFPNPDRVRTSSGQ